MKTNIIINLQFEALHHWATCPDIHPQGYLKHPHRHTFHITLKIPVNHADRDLEFIDHKHTIEVDLHSKYGGHFDYNDIADLGAMSCEMLAEELLDRWDAVYVSVLEDGENGAEVYRED